MHTIGIKLIRISPSRGVAIELGSALMIIYGSAMGLPLSTTHCQIGATVAVGLYDGGFRGVNRKIIYRTMLGWIGTVLITALTAALLVGPNPEPPKDLYC